MKTKTSMLKLAKNLGSVGLLITIQKAGVNATETNAAVYSDAQIDAEISSLASSVQKALLDSGLGSEAETESEIKTLIEEHVQNELAEDMLSEETQKTNLEDPKVDDASLTVSNHPLI